MKNLPKGNEILACEKIDHLEHVDMFQKPHDKQNKNSTWSQFFCHRPFKQTNHDCFKHKIWISNFFPSGLPTVVVKFREDCTETSWCSVASCQRTFFVSFRKVRDPCAVLTKIKWRRIGIVPNKLHKDIIRRAIFQHFEINNWKHRSFHLSFWNEYHLDPNPTFCRAFESNKQDPPLWL